MNDLIGQVLLSVGLCFTFLGCVGLVRMPDVYCRLQAATKCVTLGTGSILLAAIVMTGVSGTGVKAAVCMVFLFLNSPTAAHALARAARSSGIKVWQKQDGAKKDI